MEAYDGLQEVADLLATIIIDNMELGQDRPLPSVEEGDDWNNAA